MQDLFESFIKDRRYAKGVSVRTEGTLTCKLKTSKPSIANLVCCPGASSALVCSFSCGL
jgi:hypothetical protein